MNILDKQVQEAFNEPYVKPKAEEEQSFVCVYRFTEAGIELTEQSKRDEKAYLEDLKKEETLEESWDNLSLDEKFKSAFAK